MKDNMADNMTGNKVEEREGKHEGVMKERVTTVEIEY